MVRDSWTNRLCCCLNTTCTGAKDPHTRVLQSKNNTPGMFSLVLGALQHSQAGLSGLESLLSHKVLCCCLSPRKSWFHHSEPGTFDGSARGDAKLSFTKIPKQNPQTHLFHEELPVKTRVFSLLTWRHWRCCCDPGFSVTFSRALGGGTTSKAVAEQCLGVATEPKEPPVLWHCHGLAGKEPWHPSVPFHPLQDSQPPQGHADFPAEEEPGGRGRGRDQEANLGSQTIAIV